MRGAAFAVATTFVAIAGCGLATSGLFDPTSATPGLDASPVVTPVVDSSGSGTPDAAGTISDSGNDTSVPSGDDDASDASSAADADAAACTQTSPPSAIATITAWPGPPPPHIDGDLSEWPCDGRVAVNGSNAAYVKTGPHPLSAQIQARWDKQAIYVAVHVIDTSVGGGDLVNPYNNDSVEVYVSAGQALDGDYDSLTHQYITDWKGLIGDYGPSHAGQLPDTMHTHFTAAAKTVSDGWTYEAAIGWQPLYASGDNDFAAGTNLALDFEINDGDGTSQVAALVLTMAPAAASCSCVQTGCCCGNTTDVPSCDSARIGRVTLQ